MVDRLTSMAVFVAASEEGSLVAAARRHNLSPSMAGKHVAAIEADLGVRLMQRNTRSLVLTDAGRAYLARCKRILDEHDEAKREAGDAREVLRGVLRIGAPVTYGTMCLSGVMAEFLERHPEIVLDVVLSDRYVDLLADGIDVAIRIGRLRDSGLIAKRIAACPMVLCASPAFLARAGVPNTVADVRRMPRLTYSDPVSSGDWTMVDPGGEPHVIDGPIRMTANNMQVLLSATLRGTGIAYGPSFVFDPHLATGDLVVVMPEYRIQELAVQAIYPTGRHVPRKLRAFLDHLATSLNCEST